MKSKEVTIIGSGPAGLGAALELQKNNIKNILIIDAHDRPGGLSRTVTHEGNRFDVGPHRLFTKNKEINKLWNEILGDDLKSVHRVSRIYYKNKFFNYPLKPFNALRNLGLIESSQAMFDYFLSHIQSNNKEIKSFEDWITSKFGKKLYQTFFKIYTEKVWGIYCKDISADWAAQRIKDLNLYKAVWDALKPTKNQKSVKSLIEIFDYPTYGAGMLYEKMADKISRQGGEFLFNTIVEKISLKNGKVESISIKNKNGKSIIPVKTLFSSMPLPKAVKAMRPKAEKNILEATEKLFFRGHITVNLIIDGLKIFPDHWIYIHSPEVKMGRVANYNNFSPYMPADKETTVIGVEYFVFENDETWNMPDEDIIEMAKKELDYINLIGKNKIIDGFVMREIDSYPVYFIGYADYYKTIKKFISAFPNLQCIGRGGMYKYNNQDHSLYTGMLAARNYCGSNYNVWNVNIDAEYHESLTTGEKDST